MFEMNWCQQILFFAINVGGVSPKIAHRFWMQ
jgi:hypothetical protein